jgi:hypothetical protein
MKLLSRLREELLAAELTHNFHANSTGTWEGDVNISTASSFAFLPNLWTLKFLGLSSSEQRVEDISEVDLMGFHAFSGGQTVGNATPPSFAEAAERPTYTTANIRHDPMGDATFGDISMIFTPSYAQPLALLEPVDTGSFQEACNSTRPTQCSHYPFEMNCSGWPAPHTQGTFSHPTHMLLANVHLWGACGDPLLRTFEALCGEGGAPLLAPWDEMSFMEPDLAGAVQYPHGVKLIVAEFSSLFGNELGERVRAFCIQWGWALAWGLSSQMRASANVSAAAHLRSIDPVVAGHASLNISISPESNGTFGAVWREVGASRPPVYNASSWAAYWAQLPSTLDLSSGLRAGQCSDLDRCVGMRPRSKDCVCYA